MSTTIPLPKRILKRDERWHKGLFVAANVLIGEDGLPKFGKTQGVGQMMLDRRCQLCGHEIGPRTWKVLPGTDFTRPNHYEEAPLHLDCARYSLQVCPHILSKRSSFRLQVCKSYVVKYDEWAVASDMGDSLFVDGIIPDYRKLSGLDQTRLLFAHRYGSGSWRECLDCGTDDFTVMAYDEFMRWSA